MGNIRSCKVLPKQKSLKKKAIVLMRSNKKLFSIVDIVMQLNLLKSNIMILSFQSLPMKVVN